MSVGDPLSRPQEARHIAEAVSALIPHAESAGLLELVEILIAARTAAESAARRAP